MPISIAALRRAQRDMNRRYGGSTGSTFHYRTPSGMSSESLQKMSSDPASSPSDIWTDEEVRSPSAAESPLPARRPPSPTPESAFKESLRKLRPPGLERMLSLGPSEQSGHVRPRRFGLPAFAAASGSSWLPSPPAAADEPDVHRWWGTFPGRRRPAAAAVSGSSSTSSVEGTPTIRDVTLRPRRLDLCPVQSNQSMILQEAISESLCLMSGTGAGAASGSRNNSPSPEADSISYYSPVLPDFFDSIASSRLPSNVKELQMQLKTAQDECFTLKMSLHFMEEDYKRSLGPGDLTKENVKLKVDITHLKDLLNKKDQLLHSALTVLKKSENTDLAAKEREWAAEKKEIEDRLIDMEQLWSQRVAELEHRLGLASEPTSASASTPSLGSGSATTDGKVVSNLDEPGSQRSESSSHEQGNNDKIVASLQENLKSIQQQMKEMEKEHASSMKGKDQELHSLHLAVKEKNQQVQRLLLERNRLLEDTQQKVVDLMTLCSAKDDEISKLQTICANLGQPTQDGNNNINSNSNLERQGLGQESVTQLLAQVTQLRQELEQTKGEKCRVVEEAEILDQQQQELSERNEVLSQELRTMQREKVEISALLASAQQNLALKKNCSCSSSSTQSEARKLEESNKLGKKGGTKEEGLKDRRKLIEEVKRLRKESSEKDRRLQKALEEVQHLKNRGKEQQSCQEEARTKMTTTKSSSRPLYEPKQRKASISIGSEAELSTSSKTGKMSDNSGCALSTTTPQSGSSPPGNTSLLSVNDFLNQNLESLSVEQLRERLLRTESLCLSMQSHLEDMSEFFTALLGNGDLKRFEKTLTPKEVHRLKSLMDRTMSISFTNRSQSNLLLDLTSSFLHESEPENQSRDRDLSIVSIISHVKAFKDFVSDSETDSVAVLSSSCGEPTGRPCSVDSDKTCQGFHSKPVSPLSFEGSCSDEVLRYDESNREEGEFKPQRRRWSSAPYCQSPSVCFPKEEPYISGNKQPFDAGNRTNASPQKEQLLILEATDSEDILLLLNDHGQPADVRLHKRAAPPTVEKKATSLSSSRDNLFNSGLSSQNVPTLDRSWQERLQKLVDKPRSPPPLALPTPVTENMPAVRTNTDLVVPLQAWSSDSDIWSEPDRHVALQRMGILQERGSLLSPVLAFEANPRPPTSRHSGRRHHCHHHHHHHQHHYLHGMPNNDSNNSSSICGGEDHVRRRSYPLQRGYLCCHAAQPCCFSTTPHEDRSTLALPGPSGQSIGQEPNCRRSRHSSGRSRHSRILSMADQSTMTSSLVQGLLEVLRQAERSAKRLCSELDTFAQSHLFKLLVEEILDKLKQENLLEGATPGREWEEVSQGLETFCHKSQEVIQAASLVRGCLKEGLEHLSKTSQCQNTSLERQQHLSSPVNTRQGGEDTVPVDRPWFKALLDAHYHLALKVEGQVQQLAALSSASRDGSHLACETIIRDLLNLWSDRETCDDESLWYKDRMQMLLESLPLLQQVLQNTFCILIQSIQDLETTVKESSERLKAMEAGQECRLKEIKQIQDWNLRLQAEQKSKENLLQLLKAKEGELIAKVKEQAEEIHRLMADTNRNENEEMLRKHLDTALSDLKNYKTREEEMKTLMKDQGFEINRLSSTLETEKLSVQKLGAQLHSTMTKLAAVQKSEKTVSEFLDKEVKAKSCLEATILKLETELEKQAAVNITEDLESVVSKLTSAEAELKTYRSREQAMVEKMNFQNREIQKLSRDLEHEKASSSQESVATTKLSQQLEKAMLDLKASECREMEAVEKMKDQNEELQRLLSELNSEKKSVQKLTSQLDTVMARLEAMESNEKVISDMMAKTVQAKNDLDVSAQALKTTAYKQATEKFESELKNTRHNLEASTAKLKNMEHQYSMLQQELAKSQAKYNNSQVEWKQKVEQERKEQMRLELEIQHTRQAIDNQSKMCLEATSKAERLSDQLQKTLKKLQEAEQEIQMQVMEIERTRCRAEVLEVELLDLKTRSVVDSDVLDQKKKSIRKELWPLDSGEQTKSKQEVPELATDYLKSEELVQIESTKQLLDVSEVENKWKEKITLLEKDNTRLHEEVQESHRTNQQLQAQLASYEEKIRAISQKPSADIVYNHPCFSVPPSDSSSKPSNDLLGEMRELKKEVVLNNHSSARLCRELQQHGRPCLRQHCPLGSSTHQKSPIRPKLVDRSSSSSPDSETAEAKRRQLLEGINGDTSSGTGSAETLTMLTASSEASVSSNLATSSEELRTVNPTLSVNVKPRRVPGFLSTTAPNGQCRSFVASEERWNRTSSSPENLSRTSSDTSLLHCRVLRQLNGEMEMQNDGSLSAQDCAQNDNVSPLFQYEGPLVLMLAPSACQNEGEGGGDTNENILQRSNYSSPDLGIESDPNLVSSRSSSTSSSDSRPPGSQTRIQTKSHFNNSGTGSIVLQRNDRQLSTITGERQSETEFSLRRPELLDSQAVGVELSLNSCQQPAENDCRSGSPGVILHGLCSLRDLELLRQEMEEALVTLQGTKAAVQNRLNSKKLSSPAKSLEYSTLKEVDTRCLQLTEYLLRCKKLLNSFKTLPMVTSTLQSWSPKLQASTTGQVLHLLDSNELSLTASTETISYKDEMQKGTDENEFLKNQVVNLQKKLLSLEEEHRKALDQIKANKDKTKMVNRALEKQLNATTKVIKMAKGNLKQNAIIEVGVYQPSEATKNKRS